MNDICTKEKRLCCRSEHEDFCWENDPSGKWVCTRETGHSGSHVACAGGNNKHNLATWGEGHSVSLIATLIEAGDGATPDGIAPGLHFATTAEELKQITSLPLYRKAKLTIEWSEE